MKLPRSPLAALGFALIWTFLIDPDGNNVEAVCT